MGIRSANLGFPRIGLKRELKKALENYWKGNISKQELINVSKEIRKNNWLLQKEAKIDHIPSNDFSFYDQILDMVTLLGVIPSRYGKNDGQNIDLDTYFAMARGRQEGGVDVQAMEMTKWFDTNYHYIVPEFVNNQQFNICSNKIFDEFTEAKQLGITTKPVLVGPVSFLLLGKMENAGGDFNKNLQLLPNLINVYVDIINKLADLGAEVIQIDEPFLVTDLSDAAKAAYKDAYAKISKVTKARNVKLNIATYFAAIDDNTELALSLGADILHVDLVRGKGQEEQIISKLPANMAISLGLVDGRNVWINNVQASLDVINKVQKTLSDDRIIVAPSCSLLHSPIDLAVETELSAEIKSWMSFAKQKLVEVKMLKALANNPDDLEANTYLNANQTAIQNRKTSNIVNNKAVQDRVANISEADLHRDSAYAARKKAQAKLLPLPLLPTTTIGSFPQTKEVRAMRAGYKKGDISAAEYNEFLRNETKKAVEIQEDIGLDVLVHGEFERNDMVEYFGEQLDGYAFTKNGWVQSYGSRCVKPPVIFGDVSRPNPMTVAWSSYAQSLTSKYMKGMLTGPVTILQWSFVRDDQPRKTTCEQIALAIRDEVADLEKNGIRIIQIDEPAIREGLPIRNSEKAAYLEWAVNCFKISASVVSDETQIHTHMCYSEFNDIISNVADMDADVISIETSRSRMELLDAFVNFKYPNDIGPGVYDIHSPRVPNRQEIEELMRKALKVLPVEQLWINPDCGLKTRGWAETKDALIQMVEATKSFRNELAKAS